MTVFCDVAPRILVEDYRRFIRAYCLHWWWRQQAPTTVNFYQTTRRNIPRDSHLHTRRRENLKSHQNKSRLNLQAGRPFCVCVWGGGGRVQKNSNVYKILPSHPIPRKWQNPVICNYRWGHVLGYGNFLAIKAKAKAPSAKFFQLFVLGY
jgi:hypothetical protein